MVRDALKHGAEIEDETAATASDEAAIQHEGSSVKQGLRGQSVRDGERGRSEFNGRGEGEVLGSERAERAGRHYGRSGPESPGPGYGVGPLQVDAIVEEQLKPAPGEAPPNAPRRDRER